MPGYKQYKKLKMEEAKNDTKSTTPSPIKTTIATATTPEKPVEAMDTSVTKSTPGT